MASIVRISGKRSKFIAETKDATQHITTYETKFLVQVRRKGVSLSKTFDDHIDAMKWGHDQELLIENGAITKEDQEKEAIPTLHDLLERFRNQVSKHRKSARTEGYIISRLQRERFTKLRADKVERMMIVEFEERRMNETTPRTVLYDLTTLRECYNRAITKWGCKMVNPFEANGQLEKYEFPKAPPPRKVRLDDMNVFLDAVNDYTAGGKEFQIFCKWQHLTAMRRSESLNMTWNDVKEKRKKVFLKDSKNSTSREVPIGDDAIELLQQLRLNPFKPFQNLTPDSVKNHWNKMMKKAGITDYRLHDLRRERLSWLSENGFTAQEIKLISGHKNLDMVDRYCVVSEKHVSDKLAALTKPVAQAAA